MAILTDSAGKHLLKLSAQVNGEDEWPSAGLQVGSRASAYLSLNAMVGSPPNRWSALLLSGLPQLRDPAASKTTGWLLAGTDLTLLAGGIGALVLSVVAHNRAADGTDSSLHTANALLDVGGVLLGLVAVERFVSALTYTPGTPNGVDR